jgi:hypothetical protein
MPGPNEAKRLMKKMERLKKKQDWKEDQNFQREYTVLCEFLLSYKEKLILTKKLHNILDD